MTVRIKRAYEPPGKSDGLRILVDRVWPRGVKKTDARINLWLKDVAPTASLRTWFGHEPERWDRFRKRYLAELSESDALAKLRDLTVVRKRVTLVYGARDTEHNQASVLNKRSRRRKSPAKRVRRPS